MDTPIYDFLKKYSESQTTRFHMPGHKGKSFLGCETYDITEICGADNLYDTDGIIAASEQNATELFGTGRTFYSTEGSSLSIKAMIYAAYITSGNKSKKILAVRNVHKSFINACALLGIDIEWIYPENFNSLCSGTVTPEQVESALSANNSFFALYLTSPNYLGQITDIKAVAEICKKFDIPLLVDNAHGAYLKFFGMHPIDLGADICCDSAHKTLPSLTGGAYLHVSKEKSDVYAPYIKNAMSAFGSTSPSYLIMASLDLCNVYLSCGYENKLKSYAEKAEELKKALHDYDFFETEPLKITIRCNGDKLAKELRELGIECEYSDCCSIVLMFSPENSEIDFEKLYNSLSILKPDSAVHTPKIIPGTKVMTVREAFISPYKTVDISDSIGKICATPCISCPPAIPIAISGEIITQETVRIFRFYNINKVNIIE